MNKVLEDKRTMFEAILSLLSANMTTIALVTGFTDAVNFFKELLQKIDFKAKERDEMTAGKTAAKHAAEQTLIEAIMKTASAVFLFARKTSDLLLKEKANVLESSLTRMRDTDLAAKGDSVLNLVRQYAEQLIAFGVTATEISDLEAKINAYRTALGKSASSVSERKGARETLESLIKQTDEFLAEEIDRFMERLRSAEPELYASYCDARYIRKMGVRHEKEQPSPADQPAAVPVK
jgi:hypothetical protein